LNNDAKISLFFCVAVIRKIASSFHFTLGYSSSDVCICLNENMKRLCSIHKKGNEKAKKSGKKKSYSNKSISFFALFFFFSHFLEVLEGVKKK